MNSNLYKQIVTESFKSKGYLVINKILIEKIGLLEAVVLSSYIDKDNYHAKNENYNGEFYLTHEKLAKELNLKPYTIKNVKQNLINFGMIVSSRKGLPAKEYISISYETIFHFVFSKNDFGQDPKFSGGLDPKFSGGLIKKDINTSINTFYNKNNNKVNKPKTKNISVGTSPTGRDSENEKYKNLAVLLGNIVSSKKNVKINGQKLNNWANSIRLLCSADGVSYERIEKAIKWYEIHHADEYVPVIESGKTLREKFIRLESAIERGSEKRTRNNNSGFVGKETLSYKKSIRL